MMHVSRRRFLEATAMLAATAPLAGVDAKGRGAPMDGVAMADAVRSGKTTPAALVEAAIARLEKANPKINAVAFPNYDRARAAAAKAAAAPLAGIPTVIKDIQPEAGLPFTNGCRGLKDVIAPATHPYLRAVGASGAISIGRSTTPEFGLTCTTEPLLTGNTRNPWSLDHTAGGSSGGSGAAVAAGVVPVAHATDGGGSIRIPAAVNGLVGLKPSRGRMAGGTAMKAVTDLSVWCCVSRTVRDTAAWYAATEATGPDQRFAPVGVVAGRGEARRLRVGAQLSGNGAPPHPEVARVFADAIRLLEKLGHRVADQPLAFDVAGAADAFSVAWGVGAARGAKAVADHLGRAPGPDDLEPLTLGWAEIGRRQTPETMAKATATLEDLAARYNAQFEALDIYMTPTLGRPPVRIGELAPTRPYGDVQALLNDYVRYTPMENVSGAPAISLPIGMSRDGLPIGIQFASKPGGEKLLLELAYALEAELEWHKRIPPVWVG
ncbi:MAG: amidase [Alphaproteobacteria bacterium]|nr:amidase [Alphaproteobacteria bacterium]